MPREDFERLFRYLLFCCPATFHEWLFNKLQFANELSLKARLAQLIAPFEIHFGGAPETEMLLTLARDTRNYFTHFDKKLETKAAKGHRLFVLCEKLECLIQLQFLSRLGLSDNIDDIVKANSRIAAALKEQLVP